MSLEEKSQEQIEQEIREHEEQLDALRRARMSAARGSAKPKRPRKPRLGAVVIAPGIVASTVPGSLYSTILMKMALIGRFALQDRLFREFRDDPTPERARHLLDEIGVAFSELEQSVRQNHEYREHCSRRTVLLKNRTARGDLKAAKILNNPEICQDGKWVGDLREAIGILKGGGRLGQWTRGRNVRILRRIGLMFATSQRDGQLFCYLYRRVHHPLFTEARRLAKE